MQTDIPEIPRIYTPNGIFDTLCDRFGNKHTLTDLDLRTSKPLGGTSALNGVPSVSCQSGYFTLYFAPGTIFTGSLGVQARAVACQVFADISTLIISNCPPGSINIYCADTPTSAPGTLGAASSYFSVPNSALSANQGIIDNQVHKYLISGVDPYNTIPISFATVSNFYHGIVVMNPNILWNFNLSVLNISSNEYDFYTVLLHEVIHLLGFHTLINQNGASMAGQWGNYFTRYDQFLYDGSGTKLLANGTSTSCPVNNLTFVPNPTVIASATTGCIPDVTPLCNAAVQYSSSNVNVPVYTPNCYEQGSSLSHFEDMCPLSATVDLGCATNTVSMLNNNLYYVMTDVTGSGSCSVKRHPKEQEKLVLCDLGYSVAPGYYNVPLS